MVRLEAQPGEQRETDDLAETDREQMDEQCSPEHAEQHRLRRVTIPAFWVHVLAGGAFIAFGLWTLRGDELNDPDRLTERRWGPLMTVATTFFLAELGDKTMLMTITLASQHHSFVGVWIGSSLGMVVADGLAIIAGRILGAQLPERVIKYGAAGIFLVTGVATLIEAASNRALP